MNRLYRGLDGSPPIPALPAYRVFFSLGECLKANRLSRVVESARSAGVEMMTHPIHETEKNWLLSDAFEKTMGGLRLAPYAAL